MQTPLVALLTFVLVAGLAAQTARLPIGPFTAGEDAVPLASSPSRFQQWYAAPELLTVMRGPVRIRRLAFLAGNVLQPGSTVDIEIRMAHVPAGQLPSTTFDSNLAVDNTLVLPRASLPLAAQPVPGARVITFTFLRDFLWNGTAGLLIDLKVYGNGNGNQSYLYPCRTTLSSPGQTLRLFAPGNPAGLSRATLFQNGIGLVTEFDYAEGATVSFGTGCPGFGSQAPEAGTSGGLPIPPNAAWTQTLANAAPLAPTVLVAGSSRTNFAGGSLPFDLGLIGFPGCLLRVEPLVFLPATSTAGGFATVPMPLPGITLRRRSMFTQWFVFDTAAPNGALAGSQGLWHAFG